MIGRDFYADQPGTKLVSDITALPTGEGWLYLTCWLDLATREVVGCSMADHHVATLVVDALQMAAGNGRSGPAAQRIRIAAANTPAANSKPKYTSWAIGKETGTRTRPDRATARAEVFDFIETIYNRRLRKHRVFGYLTPAEARQRHQHDLVA
ncbi:DDE-type integrase/transposase/recombinase [Streptomyces sp. NBC_01092]|uniref:DDE-type integrase/transposase/recombinase n=1 Tax=Streptomyces sp. NBC_01092 TaxID=2903748 RepID=UPI0038691B27